MSWAKLDDAFYCHPKVLALGKDLPALALWCLGLSYCVQQKTDGRISRAAVVKLVGPRYAQRWANALLRVRLWKIAPGGYLYHDYTEYNWDRARIEKRAADNRARQKRFRDSNGVSNAVTNALGDALVTGPHPIPCTSKEVQVVGGISTRSNQPARTPKIAHAIGTGSGNGHGSLSPELVAKLHAAHPEKTPAQIVALFQREAHA